MSFYVGAELTALYLFILPEGRGSLGDASRWKEGLFARALANVEKKVDLTVKMRIFLS
jgi:hypothetical protein